MNPKQQRITNRHITDCATWDTRQQYAVAIAERDETAKRIAAARLILNGQLGQSDIFLLNSQLSGKEPQRQIQILELWFDWLDAEGKFKAAYDNCRGYAASWLTVQWVRSQADLAREKVEAL